MPRRGPIWEAVGGKRQSEGCGADRPDLDPSSIVHQLVDLACVRGRVFLSVGDAFVGLAGMQTWGEEQRQHGVAGDVFVLYSSRGNLEQGALCSRHFVSPLRKGILTLRTCTTGWRKGSWGSPTEASTRIQQTVCSRPWPFDSLVFWFPQRLTVL